MGLGPRSSRAKRGSRLEKAPKKNSNGGNAGQDRRVERLHPPCRHTRRQDAVDREARCSPTASRASIQIKGSQTSTPSRGTHALYHQQGQSRAIIGTLGQTLGENGVNIANFTLGRSDARRGEGDRAALPRRNSRPAECAGQADRDRACFQQVRPLQFSTRPERLSPPARPLNFAAGRSFAHGSNAACNEPDGGADDRGPFRDLDGFLP